MARRIDRNSAGSVLPIVFKKDIIRARVGNVDSSLATFGYLRFLPDRQSIWSLRVSIRLRRWRRSGRGIPDDFQDLSTLPTIEDPSPRIPKHKRTSHVVAVADR